ncbi:MAG: AraC family transcriptional regulator of adaptative response [Cocleimonas sp.]|jgi:AraC family transcriptional regulator of adaptative response/methylated-DNA-[protein]-cysteine methyltransferase
METIIAEEIETPVGTLLAASSNKGLYLLEFADVENRVTRHISHLEKTFKATITLHKDESHIIQQLKSELIEYFNGERKTFDITLDFRGTRISRKCVECTIKNTLRRNTVL